MPKFQEARKILERRPNAIYPGRQSSISGLIAPDVHCLEGSQSVSRTVKTELELMKENITIVLCFSYLNTFLF
jgi:hypothetical protein